MSVTTADVQRRARMALILRARPGKPAKFDGDKDGFRTGPSGKDNIPYTAAAKRLAAKLGGGTEGSKAPAKATAAKKATPSKAMQDRRRLADSLADEYGREAESLRYADPDSPDERRSARLALVAEKLREPGTTSAGLRREATRLRELAKTDRDNADQLRGTADEMTKAADRLAGRTTTASKKAAPAKKATAGDRVARSRKSRTEQPAGYPKRFAVPDGKAAWDTEYPNYDPPEYTAPAVVANDRTVKSGGWADPADVSAVDREFASYEGPVELDEQGRPRNPYTRTGIQGRGLLGKWGANPAADPIVTRENPETGQMEIALIQRGDTGEWAIPGGMVDEGEQVSATLAREFREETGADLDMTGAREVYKGYVDDPRNTDNAWMETTVMHRHLTPEEAEQVQFGSAGLETGEVRAIRWVPVDQKLLDNLYASHGEFVRKALRDRLPVKKAAKKAAPAKAAKAPAKATPRKAAPASPLDQTYATGTGGTITGLEAAKRMHGDWEANPSLLDRMSGPNLRSVARHYGLPTAGNNKQLADRIKAHLSGRSAPAKKAAAPRAEFDPDEFARRIVDIPRLAGATAGDRYRQDIDAELSGLDARQLRRVATALSAPIPAKRREGGTWTRENLRAYIAEQVVSDRTRWSLGGGAPTQEEADLRDRAREGREAGLTPHHSRAYARSGLTVAEYRAADLSLTEAMDFANSGQSWDEWIAARRAAAGSPETNTADRIAASRAADSAGLVGDERAAFLEWARNNPGRSVAEWQGMRAREAEAARRPSFDPDAVAERIAGADVQRLTQAEIVARLDGLDARQLRRVATAVNLPLPARPPGGGDWTRAALAAFIAENIVRDRRRYSLR